MKKIHFQSLKAFQLRQICKRRAHTTYSLTLFFILWIFFLTTGQTAFALDQTIIERQAVEGVTITIKHQKGVFWQAHIINHAPTGVLTIDWDKSSYRSSSGRTSRLIQAGSTKIHPTENQEPTLLPANQEIQIEFTCEDLLPYAKWESLPPPSNPKAQGALSIALRQQSVHRIWQGNVQFTNTEKKEI